MLPIEEVQRRRRLIGDLSAELQSRGWHVGNRGIQIWVAPVFLGPGREVGVDGSDFVWQRGSFSGPPIAPVEDVPHAVDLIQKEISAGT